MRNYKYILVIAAAVVMAFAGCTTDANELIFGDGSQTVINIINMGAHNGKYATGALASSKDSATNKDLAVGWVETITAGQINMRMWNATTQEPASVTAKSAFVILMIYNNKNLSGNPVYTGYYPLGVSPGLNPSINFESFEQIP